MLPLLLLMPLIAAITPAAAMPRYADAAACRLRLLLLRFT